MSETAVKVSVHRAIKSLGDDLGEVRPWELTISSHAFHRSGARPPRRRGAQSGRGSGRWGWPRHFLCCCLHWGCGPTLAPRSWARRSGSSSPIPSHWCAWALDGGAPIARIRRCATARWAAGCAGAALAASRRCRSAPRRPTAALMMGHSARVCSLLILALSLADLCGCVLGDAHPGADAADPGGRLRGPSRGRRQRHTLLPALSGSGGAIRPDLVFAGHSSGHGAGRCGGALGAALVAKPNLTGRC